MRMSRLVMRNSNAYPWRPLGVWLPPAAPVCQPGTCPPPATTYSVCESALLVCAPSVVSEPSASPPLPSETPHEGTALTPGTTPPGSSWTPGRVPQQPSGPKGAAYAPPSSSLPPPPPSSSAPVPNPSPRRQPTPHIGLGSTASHKKEKDPMITVAGHRGARRGSRSTRQCTWRKGGCNTSETKVGSDDKGNVLCCPTTQGPLWRNSNPPSPPTPFQKCVADKCYDAKNVGSCIKDNCSWWITQTRPPGGKKTSGTLRIARSRRRRARRGLSQPSASFDLGECLRKCGGKPKEQACRKKCFNSSVR